jgi:hypothetical protein
MTIPTVGYPSTINPIASRPVAGLRSSAAVPDARAVTPPPADSGVSQRAAATTTSEKGLSRPSLALLESLQASMKTATLLSTLVTQPGSGFSSTSPMTLLLNGQTQPIRPTRALLESLQSGQQTSALLSSLSPTDRGTGFYNATRQPSAEGNKSALGAYIQELRSQLGSGSRPVGSGWPHEWFA